MGRNTNWNEPLAQMEGAAARMGDAVSMSTDALCRGFAQLENLLDVIAQQLRPATEKLRPLAAPLSTIAAEAEAVVEPGGVHADHQRAIAEYIPALMFPLCTGASVGLDTPPQYVAQHWDSAVFYLNRARRGCQAAAAPNEQEWGDSPAPSVAWIAAFGAVHRALVDLLSQKHPKDPAWGTVRESAHATERAPQRGTEDKRGGTPNRGLRGEAADTGEDGAGSVVCGSVATKTPPKAPAVDVKALLAKSAARLGSATSGAGGTGTAAYGVAEKHESGGGRIALFEEIRRGKVLRKVPEDKQRRGGPAPSRGGARRAAEQEVDRRQGRIARDGGSRWVVEGWEGQEEVAVQGVAMGEGVQVMGCKKSMVAVEGKVNAVVIEHCEGLGLLMGSAVSVVEAIRCERLRLQVKGTAPLIEVDSSTDVTLYLSPECAEMVQIVTTRSSSVRVAVLRGPGEDVEEWLIPEQLSSRVIDGKLVSTVLDKIW